MPIGMVPRLESLIRKSAIANRQSQMSMYRRPRFLEVLHAIREEMSREADYDVDLFAEMIRSGARPSHGPVRLIRGFRTRAPRAEKLNGNMKTPARRSKAETRNNKSPRI
ncbi:MAG: hypothetical protein C5B44_06930 [Acidobacteria bacterium]|nr:MAG: hypothetical protein C5B44_06930 [Acidobacteriota bacterium]